MRNKGRIVIAAILGMLLATGCHNKSDEYLGDWLEQHSEPQTGFYLGNGGLASSIGHPATQYTKWNVIGKDLILHGKRYSHGMTEVFSDTLTITHFTPRQMTVWNKNKKIVYVRMADRVNDEKK
ncbi:MAG: lipocalin family protein [Bacteroidales bacterium]|nr:lipocalin family protein [Bacteroidales bacterium]